MTSQARYSLPPVPAELSGLVELALDVRWSWSHTSDVLWRRLDTALWEATHNPWHILQTVARSRLQEAASDPRFIAELNQQVESRRGSLEAATWFDKTYPGEPGARLGPVAYFCMEFGLSEALPIYSGGLGILAGDFLKTASDMGVPVVGVGLLWQQGYFRQALSASGDQLEVFPFNDPGLLPITPLRDADGEWVSVSISLPRRTLLLRAWEVQAGRVRLFLLDSNDVLNVPVDRGIAGELYGGGAEMRLQQEMALGIGGWRLLEGLGIAPEVCHLNEGHAAFAVLERARAHMLAHSVRFEQALIATRAGNIFTTHTPVEAGFDRFSPALVTEYLGGYADELGLGIEELLSLGRPPGGGDPGRLFNMAYLAMRGSGAVNGVSRLHGDVARKLFQPLFPRWPLAEIPVGHVTNGVHVPSWDSREADHLWTQACGKERWLGDPFRATEAIRNVSDEDLWMLREISRRTLIAEAREHVRQQGPTAGSLEALGDDPSCLCDPTVLTLGFARRFATYKRANLLLHDPDRLQRLLCGPDSRMQLILAGKAHPADAAGKAMIRQWTDFIRGCSVRPRIVFLIDYDMGIAEHLVHGIDVWINTPRRPWEACGTSGMKVLVNGGLNLSELDGWWAEAYAPDVGWALGDRQEHDSDAGWDAHEAEQLYDLLENQILPEFYDCDEHGIPRRWVARVRESMARLAPEFSANRMMKDYLDLYYLPASAGFRERNGPAEGEHPGGGALQPSPARVVAGIDAWRTLLDQHWNSIRFLDYSLTEKEVSGETSFEAAVRLELGSVPPDAVLVQLFADPLNGGPPERLVLMTDVGAMKPRSPGEMATQPGEYAFKLVFPAERPASDYTPRVVPSHRFGRAPLEAAHILWYR